MRVIGAGFGRTGTESLQAALERLLGGRCYHMKEVLGNADHLARWVEFGEAGRQGMNWETLLQGYSAGVDWPICNYYQELMAVFPDAKVVLTVRDPERWFESYLNLVGFSRKASMFGVLVPNLRRMRRMINTAVWHIFDDRTDRAHVIDVFNRHIETVKATVPPERLLVFRVQDGWEPLCEFLGCEVPDEPFPHKNRRGEFRKMARRMMTSEVLQAARFPMLFAMMGGAFAYGVKKYLRARKR